MKVYEDRERLDWSVYSGPELIKNDAGSKWEKKKCTVTSLAQILHNENEPVVVLQGRAELGRRALGNRSIIAPAVSKKMQDILNKVKKREEYRPISPICLENRAKEVFDSGTRDPFMIFDHYAKKEWKDKIPAVVHIDGTARLQTVAKGDNPVIYELLEEYEKLSRVPVLCNTSANLWGKGFFADVRSAANWGKVNYIWSEGKLYSKKIKEKLL